MPDLLSLPDGAPVVGTDRVMILRGSTLYTVQVSDLHAGLQAALSLAQGAVVGRKTAGTGAAEAMGLGAGVALAAGNIVANGQDHLGLAPAALMDLNAEVVVNSGGVPKRMPIALLAATALSSGIAANVSAAVGGQGGATAVTAAIAVVTTVASGAGVRLVAGSGDTTRKVLNACGTGTDLLVYPPSGHRIALSGLATNAAAAIPDGGNVTFVWDGNTTWYIA